MKEKNYICEVKILLQRVVKCQKHQLETKMHILELPSIFFPRGGAFCLDQAKALACHGHEVRIMACVELGITETPMAYMSLPFGTDWTTSDGIETLTSYIRRIPKCIRRNNSRWLSCVMLMMEEYVRRHGLPDIIHAHSVHWAGYAAMKLSEQWNVPFVITEHSSRAIFEMEFGKGVTDCWQIPLLKEALRKAKMVIPVADELVANLCPLLGTDYDYEALSNTIDTGFFIPRKRAPHRGFRFVYPAVFFPLKAHDLLFEALRKVASFHSDVELHLSGRGTDRREMRRLTERYGVSNMVRTYGQLDKAAMRQLYYASDCLVVPSRSEAQPLICLEAAATGIPFVGTEVIPRCLRLPDCPIVPIDDASALAKAMSEMVASSHCQDWSRLYEVVREMASPESFAQKFENIIAT